MRHRSVSGSSLDVQHSSPMSVPSSARQRNFNVFPMRTEIPAGTIPDTPGPLQRAFDRDPANHASWRDASPTPMERPPTPMLTPLPGTNLSLEEFNTALALPPSVATSLIQTGQANPGYFDIPVHEQPQICNNYGVEFDNDDADVLNGLACLKLAAKHDDKTEASSGIDPYVTVADHGRAEEKRREYEHSELRDSVCTPRVPQHQRTLVLRPKQQTEDLQGRVRKDSAIAEDWDASSNRLLVTKTQETSPKRVVPSQREEVRIASKSSALVSPDEGYRRTDDENSPSENLAYTEWESPSKSRYYVNTWGQHTGLYDGTGYGDDGTSPTTPDEPDEGTKDVSMQLGPRSMMDSPSFSIDGDAPAKKMFTRAPTCQDAYAEYVHESSPLPAD